MKVFRALHSVVAVSPEASFSKIQAGYLISSLTGKNRKYRYRKISLKQVPRRLFSSVSMTDITEIVRKAEVID